MCALAPGVCVGWRPSSGASRHLLPEGEGKQASSRSQSALKPHHLAGPHALVGGEDDAQRVDRVLEVLAEIDLATDRLEEQALLALA